MPEEIKAPNNQEIDEALKEFEAKSNTKKVQKISEASKTSKTPKMIQFVMKYSGETIKEEQQAEYFLLGFVVLAIIISLFLFFGNIGSRGAKPLTKSQIEQIIKNQQNMQTPKI